MANTKVPAELSSTPGIIDNSSATALTIDSAGAATFSGNVGIGTSSPSTALDVSGAVTVTRSDVPDDHSTISNEGGLFVISAATGGGGGTYPILFKTASAERMRIDSSGNVGIGVVPEAWTYFSPIQAKRSSFAGSDGQTGVGYNWYFDGAYKYIANDYALAYQQNATSGAHSWSTAASGTADSAITWSESLRIDASGNVLVGTTSKFNGYPTRFTTTSLSTPSSEEACHILELVGNRTTNAGNQNGMIQFWNTTSTAAETARISGIQGTGLNSGALTFATYAAGTYIEAMILDQNGNVGIGTNTPAASLHIAATNNNYNGIMKLGARTWFSHTDEGQTHTFLANDYNDNAAQFGIRMKGVAESDEKFTILGSGNVGIGTITPSSKLTVDSGTTNTAYSPTSFNTASQIKINVASTQNNYAGIQFTHAGNTEGFIGLVRTSTTTSEADFVVQSYTPSVGYTEKLRIDNSGIVTKPYQPSWGALSLSNASVSSGTANTNETLVFPTVVNNTGNHYNNSTGIFTAPVTGRYFVTFNGLYNASDNTTGPVNIRVAGVTKYTAYHQNSGAYYEQISVSGVVYAVAGDAITIFSVIDGWHVGGETSWSGFLIG